MKKIQVIGDNNSQFLKAAYKAIKAGKDVQIIKFQNPEQVIKELEADPAVNSELANKILHTVFTNNKVKMSRLRTKNIKSVATKKARENISAKFRNSGALQNKWSETEISAVRKKRDDARAEMAKWEDYEIYTPRILQAEKVYYLCKRDPFCWSAKQKKAAWDELIKKQNTEKSKYNAAKALYDTYAEKLEDMLRDNEDYIGVQEAQQERDLQRKEEERRQEAHEAALIKAGYETENIKADIAAQMTEIMKLEQETEKAEAETNALQTASENKTYGTATTVVNESKGLDNKTLWVVAGISALLVGASVSIPLILRK